MSNTQRPSTARKHTRKTEAKRDSELDLGMAVTDPNTGIRLTVRMGDVTGIHDRALFQAFGTDFAGLLNMMSQRQGLDVLCATLWFARVVNGVDGPDFETMLGEYRYSTFVETDMGPAEAMDELPQP